MKVNTYSEFFLESSKLKKLSEESPNYQVGVHTSTIYLQIARFGQNPYREIEMKILKKAVLTAIDSNGMDSKYVMMSTQDIILCFGKMLKYLPKTAFTQRVDEV